MPPDTSASYKPDAASVPVPSPEPATGVKPYGDIRPVGGREGNRSSQPDRSTALMPQDTRAIVAENRPVVSNLPSSIPPEYHDVIPPPRPYEFSVTQGAPQSPAATPPVQTQSPTTEHTPQQASARTAEYVIQKATRNRLTGDQIAQVEKSAKGARSLLRGIQSDGELSQADRLVDAEAGQSIAAFMKGIRKHEWGSVPLATLANKDTLNTFLEQPDRQEMKKDLLKIAKRAGWRTKDHKNFNLEVIAHSFGELNKREIKFSAALKEHENNKLITVDDIYARAQHRVGEGGVPPLARVDTRPLADPAQANQQVHPTTSEKMIHPNPAWIDSSNPNANPRANINLGDKNNIPPILQSKALSKRQDLKNGSSSSPVDPLIPTEARLGEIFGLRVVENSDRAAKAGVSIMTYPGEPTLDYVIGLKKTLKEAGFNFNGSQNRITYITQSDHQQIPDPTNPKSQRFVPGSVFIPADMLTPANMKILQKLDDGGNLRKFPWKPNLLPDDNNCVLAKTTPIRSQRTVDAMHEKVNPKQDKGSNGWNWRLPKDFGATF